MVEQYNTETGEITPVGNDAMLLMELFKVDKEYVGDWEGDPGDENYTVTFSAGDRDIDVIFWQIPRSGSHWELAFIERKHFNPKNRKRLDITGSGKEFDVFSHVVDIAKKFIRDNNVDSLTFSADKQNRNRARLYQKMIKRLLPVNWTLDSDHTSKDSKSTFTIFKDE